MADSTVAHARELHIINLLDELTIKAARLQALLAAVSNPGPGHQAFDGMESEEVTDYMLLTYEFASRVHEISSELAVSGWRGGEA